MLFMVGQGSGRSSMLAVILSTAGTTSAPRAVSNISPKMVGPDYLSTKNFRL